MEHYAGIDVSLELSSVCVVDAAGKICRELKVPSEPEALVQFFQQLEPAPVTIGLEAGPLSQWLYAGLVRAGFDVVLLETRHVKAALSAMPVKTDRKDARGIAQMVRMGWYRPVHCKTLAAQEIRALLAACRTGRWKPRGRPVRRPTSAGTCAGTAAASGQRIDDPVGKRRRLPQGAYQNYAGEFLASVII